VKNGSLKKSSNKSKLLFILAGANNINHSSFENSGPPARGLL